MNIGRGMNKELKKKFEDEFPQTGDKPTHFEVCKCWSCVDYREDILSFIETHTIAKKDLEREIDKLIGNCDEALKSGASSEFGSASGGIQLTGCKSALQDLKDKLL